MFPTAIISSALLPLSLAYTTINNAAQSNLLWSTGQFEVLLDVRSTEEWDAGHLPNATFIPSLQTSKDTSRLAGCEDCAIAVYCTSGYRSKRAADVLENAGFTNVYDVLGTEQWIDDAGVALVSDAEREPCCDCTECVNSKHESAGNTVRSTVLIAIVPAVVGAVLLIA